MGRSPFPNRNEWDTYLTDLQDGAVSDRIRQIRKLEAVGAKVQYISADISNEDSFQHLVSESKGHFGEVHGIFHAAGLPGDEPIANKTPAKAWKILGPKVIGTRLLEAFYEGAQLDFFVLCSSVSAFLPVVGQVDYCGASAFLDAYAQAQHLAEVKNVISVDWYAWQEIGMAAEMALPSTRLESLKDGIPPQEAPRLFDIILSVRLPQILISPITIDAVRAVNERFNALADSSGVSSGAQKTQSLRPSLATEFVPPKTESEKMLAVIWQEFLGISSIGIHDDFHDLGGNSLLAVQLISRVRVVFQVDLPLKALFECFTIAALAKKIDMSLQDQEEVEV